MPDVGEVRYKAKVDTSDVESDVKKAEDKIGKSGKKAGSQFAEGFKAGIDPAKASNEKVADAVTDKWKTASRVIGTSFAAITAGVVAFGTKSIGLASDLNEVQNVVDTTFGSKGSAVIDEWAEKAGSAFGLSELSAKQYTSTLGAMLKSMGLAEQDTLDMSIAMAGLAGDMASFYNLDPSEAFEKLRSGISGETEPLKQLGINMSVANLEAFALSQGIETAYDSMTQAEQATLRYQYIMQATADAQGDFSDTSDSLANQQRILQMEVETLSADFGTALLPAALGVVEALRGFVDWASQNGTTLSVLGVAITGVTAAVLAYTASLTLAASGMTLATAAGAAFGAVVGFITSPITLAILAITALVAAGIALYQNWDTVSVWAQETWGKIKDALANAAEGAAQAFENFKNAVSQKLKAVADAFTNLVSSVKEKVGSIRDTIVNGFQKAIDFITSLPEKAKQWGRDFMQGLVGGITEKIGDVVEAVSGIANKISSFLHFSRPDVGPLRDYETWMPDMMRGIAKGITDNTDEVDEAAEDASLSIARGIKKNVGRSAISSRLFEVVPAPVEMPTKYASFAKTPFTYTPTHNADWEGLREMARALTADVTASAKMDAQITVPVSIDGREVARATAWYMGEQLAWEERR